MSHGDESDAIKDAEIAADREKKKAAIIESLNGASNITQACKAAGIHSSTFYKWCVKDEKFNLKVELAKESRIKVVEDALVGMVANGNVTAAIFFLCNRASYRWKNVNRVEHSGKLGIEHKLTLEEKIAKGKELGVEIPQILLNRGVAVGGNRNGNNDDGKNN